MRDVVDIMQIINRAAKSTMESSKPINIVYGKVIQLSPLKVQVDQKLIIEEENLKLTRAVMDYEVEMTVNHLTESTSGGSGDASFASHNHAYTGRKKFIVHNGLVEGDLVTMIRAQGGQQYIIIDKEVM